MFFIWGNFNWKKILILKKIICIYKIYLEIFISVFCLDYYYDKYIVIYYKVIYYRYLLFYLLKNGYMICIFKN